MEKLRITLWKFVQGALNVTDRCSHGNAALRRQPAAAALELGAGIGDTAL
jgi:hypothetical protein